MDNQLWQGIGILFLILSLNACSIFQTKNQSPLCKEMKSRIVLNGATGNKALARQQKADMGVLTRSYHDEGC